MLSVIIIFLLVFIFAKNLWYLSDQFDGVGKSFGKYYKPKPDCLKKKLL